MSRHQGRTAPRATMNLRPRLESLEGRRLMAVGIDEAIAPRFGLPRLGPDTIAALDDGSVWVGSGVADGSSGGHILATTPDTFAQGKYAPVPIDAGVPVLLAQYSEEHGIVTEVFGVGSGEAAIVRYDVESQVSSTAAAIRGHFISATIGPDGGLWATYEPEGQAITLLIHPTKGLEPTSLGESFFRSMAVGPGGDLWMSPNIPGPLERVTPDGIASTASLAGLSGLFSIDSLSAGSGGSLWFTAKDISGHVGIGHISADLSVTFHGLGVGRTVSDLVPGADGSLWFNDSTEDAISRLEPSGQVDTYALPGPSPHHVDQLASDGQGGFWFLDDAQLGHLRTDLPDPDVTIQALAVDGTEGTITGDLPIAEFTTTDPKAVAADFEARVDLGSPFSIPQDGTIRAEGNGRFLVLAPDGYEVDPGTRLMTVTVMDVTHHHAIGASSILTGVATFDPVAIAVAGINLSETAGSLKLLETVASFTGPDRHYHNGSITIDWGDGTSDNSWIEVANDATPGRFDVICPHAYTRPGTYTIKTTINDSGRIASGTSTATVAPAPFAFDFQLLPQAYTDGMESSLSSSLETAHFPGHLLSGTIEWGDGTSTAIRLSNVDADGATNPGQAFLSKYAHVYAKVGSYLVTEAVDSPASDYAPSVKQATMNVTLAPLSASGSTIQAIQGAVFRETIASFRSFNSSLGAADFQARVAWGDGSPDSAGTIVAEGLGAFHVDASHTYSIAGNFGPVATITRLGLDPAITSWTDGYASVTVAAPAPFRVATIALKGTEGVAISTGVATFDDISSARIGDYSSVIAWGDGSTSPATISVYAGRFVVIASHTYAKAGTYAYGVAVARAGYLPATASGIVAIAAETRAGTPAPTAPAGGGETVTIPTPQPQPQPQPQPLPTTLPRIVASVVAAQAVAGRNGKGRLVLTYSGATEAATAGDVSRYVVTDAGKDGKFGTRDDRAVGIAGAAYDGGTHAVTIATRGAFARGHLFRVAVRGQAAMNVVVPRAKGR